MLIAEIVGALLSGSLALLADAGHMTSDAIGLTVALGVAASRLGIEGGQNQRLLNICRHFGATTYVSGDAARDYLDVPLFEQHRIAVEWQRFEHPTYPQLHGAFVPYLSALDLVLNCGSDAGRILERGRSLL